MNNINDQMRKMLAVSQKLNYQHLLIN